MKVSLALSVLVVGALTACTGDSNSEPLYGASGLPVNCRAYVQHAVDAYRSRQYDAEATMSGLERNCGRNGQIWGLTK